MPVGQPIRVLPFLGMGWPRDLGKPITMFLASGRANQSLSLGVYTLTPLGRAPWALGLKLRGTLPRTPLPHVEGACIPEATRPQPLTHPGLKV